MQKALTDLGKTYYEEPQLEVFQFGPHEPIVSEKMWHYEAGVHGVNCQLVMSEVPAGCPGLIGPDDLAARGAKLDFTPGTMQLEEDEPQYMKSNRSGHPCVGLLD